MKKVYVWLLIIVLGISFITGCSGSNDTSKPDDQSDNGVVNSDTPNDSDIVNFNEEGLPIVKEAVTYEIASSLAPNWGKPEEGEFWIELENDTNVKVKWLTFLHNEASEKYSLMMATGEYPDAFVGGFGGGDSNLLTYGSQGVYIPLNNLIEKYAVNFKSRVQSENPDIMNMITAPDGNIYAMPSVLYNPMIYNNTFINKTWLDQLGMDVPTTTDQFADVLRSFKEGDPNGNGKADEIPMSFMFNDWGASDHGGYFGAFGYPLTPDYTVIDNGKVVFLGDRPGYKEAASWLASLYSEGLIDREIFTQDESQYTAKGNAEPATFGVFSAWDRSIVAGENMDEYVPLMPLKGPNGDANWMKESITGFYRDQFIITNKAENPEILMRWIDQFYRDVEMGLNATYGIGPDPDKAWFKDDSGQIIFKEDIPEMYVRGMQQLPFAPAIIGKEGGSILAASGMGKEKEDITQSYMPFAQKFVSGEWNRWPITFMTVDEKEELSTLGSDLVTYTTNQLARWISGDGNIDAEWDNYLNELNKIGLERWTELQQNIYDRFIQK